MGAVGLLYVGAVLFINGAMLLGLVENKSAAPLNVMVGLLQVVTPTYLIFTAAGDASVILNASGLYLFGFTYLYVAFNLFGDLDGTGLGYFSLFVAACAIVYSAINVVRFDDYAFGVIWLYWAFLWALFFVILGLKREKYTRYTGAVCLTQGIVTGAIPSFLLMTDQWGQNDAMFATALAVFAVVVFGAFWPRFGPGSEPQQPAAPREGVPVES